MLLRDAPTGPEVFILRRTHLAVFAGGMYVYPGGRVDPADGDGDGAFVMAAIRECYEECGVLLATDAAGNFVGDGHPALGHRHDVYSASLDMPGLAARYGLTLATDALVWVAHWVTPRGESPRRFDTRFFLTACPPNQHSHHDDNETVASMWVRPSDAIARFERGALQLMPPTLSTMSFLVGHETVAAAMAAGRAVGTPPCIMPKMRVVSGQPSGIAMPDDADYESLD
jgi:8-oxo-dGTP pyrophosphatase MutT (NUDIX family)